MPNISNITPVLTTDDVKTAVDWYARAFGFSSTFVNKEEGDSSGETWSYALLTTGEVEIHLCKRDPNDQTLSSASNCYFHVDDIQVLHAHLSQMGADVGELQEMPWGNLECWLHDPDGNRMVLSAAM